ncbi:MAG: DNA primase, partial [Methylophilaceae bacterium]
IKADGDRILIHCFGGCETQHVLDAIGLSFADLMPEQVRGQHVYPREKKPFYAGDILKIILNEARLVYLCATDIHQNKPLDQSGRDRLLLAVKRIGHAVGVATHGI